MLEYLDSELVIQQEGRGKTPESPAIKNKHWAVFSSCPTSNAYISILIILKSGPLFLDWVTYKQGKVFNEVITNGNLRKLMNI